MHWHAVSSLESVTRFLSRLKSAGLGRKILWGKELVSSVFSFQRAVSYCLCRSNDERIWDEAQGQMSQWACGKNAALLDGPHHRVAGGIVLRVCFSSVGKVKSSGQGCPLRAGKSNSRFLTGLEARFGMTKSGVGTCRFSASEFLPLHHRVISLYPRGSNPRGHWRIPPLRKERARMGHPLWELGTQTSSEPDHALPGAKPFIPG